MRTDDLSGLVFVPLGYLAYNLHKFSAENGIGDSGSCCSEHLVSGNWFSMKPYGFVSGMLSRFGNMSNRDLMVASHRVYFLKDVGGISDMIIDVGCGDLTFSTVY